MTTTKPISSRRGRSDEPTPKFYTNRVQQQFIARRAARGLPRSAWPVLAAICTEADRSGDGRRPIKLSASYLATCTGYAKKDSVWDALNALEAAGWIVILRQSGRENAYAVRVPVDDFRPEPIAEDPAPKHDQCPESAPQLPAGRPKRPARETKEDLEARCDSDEPPPPENGGAPQNRSAPEPAPLKGAGLPPGPAPKKGAPHDTRTQNLIPHAHEGEKDLKKDRPSHTGGWSGDGIKPEEFADPDGWKPRLAEWLARYPPPPKAIELARERFVSQWVSVARKIKHRRLRNPGAYLTTCLKPGGRSARPSDCDIMTARKLLYAPAADADGNLSGGITIANIGRDPIGDAAEASQSVDRQRAELAKRFPNAAPTDWGSQTRPADPAAADNGIESAGQEG